MMLFSNAKNYILNWENAISLHKKEANPTSLTNIDILVIIHFTPPAIDDKSYRSQYFSFRKAYNYSYPESRKGTL